MCRCAAVTDSSETSFKMTSPDMNESEARLDLCCAVAPGEGICLNKLLPYVTMLASCSS